MIANENQPSEQVKKDELLDVSQAAKFLNLSPLTLYRLRKKGKLKCYQFGTRVMFSLNKHIIPYIDSCESP